MAYNKFTPLKEVSGSDLKYGLIDNSETIANGKVIIPGVQGDTSVIKTGGGTTGALLGVALSIVGKDGKVLEVNSKAVASDNATVGMIQATYIPAFIPMEYGATLDADSETTDNSSAYGNFAVDATGLLLTESSVVAFTTVIAKQFFSFGVTPGTTRDVTGYIIKKIGFTA
jgi:hypothetical protein